MPTRVLGTKIKSPSNPPKTPTTTTTPAPQETYVLGAPKGRIPTTLQIAYGRGGEWLLVNVLDPLFLKYGLKYGVLPSWLKAMAVVESGGRSIPNGNGFPNYGVMQLTHSWNGGPKTTWELVGEKLGVDFKSPEGQIAIAAYVLGGHNGDKGSVEEIFLRKYYPVKGGLDVPGPDGHTQRQYLSDVSELIKIIDAARPGEVQPLPTTTTTTTKAPAPNPPQDIVAVITGGRHTDASYGFKSPTDLGFYDYFVGHGGTAHEHTGIDASLPLGSTLYSPIEGTIVCTRTGPEAGAWGSGCAAFSDANGGAGRVEILADDGKRSLILGHCQACLVKVGTKVKIGQPVAKSGGYNGNHVHIEAREYVGGSTLYMIRDPRKLFPSGPAPQAPDLGNYTFLGTENFMSRNGVVPVALSYHITDDLDLDNVVSWFQKRGSNASSHWVIDRDGAKYQFVGSAMASFTNGDVKKPRRDIPWIDRHADAWIAGRDNANYYTISLEHVGIPGLAFTDAQIASSIEVSRYYLATYPTITPDRGHMTRHADYNSVDRPYCPGELFPLATIIQACGGNPSSFGV